MAVELLVGFVSTAMGLVLLFVALPGKDGQPARFLRNGGLSAVYPVLPLLFLTIGGAELIAAAT